jgi:hypothetical protein
VRALIGIAAVAGGDAEALGECKRFEHSAASDSPRPAAARACPQCLWTKLRTHALQSGFTPYVARAGQVWLIFDQPLISH